MRQQGRAVARKAVGAGLHVLSRLAGGPPPGLRRGADLPPADVPVLAVVVVGTTPDAVDAVVRAAGRAQRSGLAFTPVFCVDQPVLAPFRRAGYVAELVGPAGLATAIRELRLSYACAGVVVVDGASLPSWQRLPELMAGLHPGPARDPVARAQHLLRRAESRLR